VNAARARGHRATDGLTMLLEQGALAFERWFGMNPDRIAMRAALAELRDGIADLFLPLTCVVCGDLLGARARTVVVRAMLGPRSSAPGTALRAVRAPRVRPRADGERTFGLWRARAGYLHVV
jgi:hypothetical protein